MGIVREGKDCAWVQPTFAKLTLSEVNAEADLAAARDAGEADLAI